MSYRRLVVGGYLNWGIGSRGLGSLIESGRIVLALGFLGLV